VCIEKKEECREKSEKGGARDRARGEVVGEEERGWDG
jgi:hypothetical protein